MSDKNQASITVDDKAWVEDCFKWLIEAYGYPSDSIKQVLPDKNDFPRTFSNKQIDAEAVLDDVCALLWLDRKRIAVEIATDIRDSQGTPYQFEDIPVESFFEIETQNNIVSYKITLSNNLYRHPDQLVFNIILVCLRIRLAEHKVDYGDGNHEAAPFIYIMGIYFGFGVILSQNLVSTGKENMGGWERSWTYVAAIPLPVMAYAMALFCDLVKDHNPAWKKYLPPGFMKSYDSALSFVRNNPNELFNERELKAAALYQEGNRLYLDNKFEEAIAAFQKASFLTESDALKLNLYNSLGYALLRNGEYERSIPNFQKSLEINPSYGYANDNLGYAFIMTGDLDSGKFYLDIARQCGDNDDAYTYRNLALYYQNKNEPALAEINFKKAFEVKNNFVDLLEYHYARFLYAKGEKEKGMVFLKMAVLRNEPEAVRWIRELNAQQS